MQLSDQFPTIKGVVGWVDLRSEKAGAQLEEFSRNPKFVGVRHVVQDEPDNRILECAVEAESDFIISNDKDLLRLGSYAGIPIIRVADFLQRWMER